jgi:thiol-disulfide isomerase/thioredoxin
MRALAMLGGALMLASGCAGAPIEDSSQQASTGTAAPTAVSPPAVPPPADAPTGIAFTARTLDGEEFDATQALEDQPTVLWFWTPWCVICRAEAPEVTAVAADLEGEVSFVGVAGRGEEAAMRDFVTETGTGGFPHIVDDDGSIWTGFGVIAQPAFAFIDRDGDVEVFAGSMPPDELRATAAALAEE